MDYPDQHPCEEPGCHHTVLFDDEPFCFTHSPDSGSSVSGYSYKELYPSDNQGETNAD